MKKVLEPDDLKDHYRLVTEHIVDAVFLLDTDGRFMFGNRRLEELTGYRLDELLGCSSTLVLTPEGARTQKARMEAVQRGDAVPPVYETELLRKDGTRVWAEVNTSSVVEDGRMIGRVGAARDITTRKDGERRRAAESAVGIALAQAATVSAAAVAVLQATGEALGWDVGAVWMVDPEAGLLRCLDVWHAGAARAPALEAATRPLTLGRGVGLLGRVWAQGVPLWIADVATEPNLPRAPAAAADNFHTFLGFPLGVGPDVIGVVEFISREIRPPNPVMLDLALSVGRQFAHFSDRKRAEAALQKSEDRFRAMFEQAAVGIGETSTGGRWLRVNRRLCDILGYTRDELLERTLQDITHPDDLDTHLARDEPLLAGQVRTPSREKRYFHKDGSTIWVDVTVSLVRDPAGEPAYFIAVVQDITARRQLEQEVHHAQRMEGVGQLAGGIAHDFNNLLTIINGRCALILASLPPAHPLQRHVGLIEKTVVRATALTRQLLAFSRKQVLQPKVVGINELVARSMELLTRLIGEDIDLAFVPAQDAGRIHVDRGQLEQVIVNLVLNARDAMPDGGRITIETANTALDAAYASRHVDVTPGRYVVLVVSDTGTGMSAAVRARIFEPFFTTKEPGKGTGLGLATAYGIMKQSGGHIRVYSEPGTGTTFKIYLPRTDAATQDLDTPTAGAAPRGTETILLVEDEAEVRSLAREVLEGLGYTVLEAGTPTQALELAERHPGSLDLLLTDVIMPRMSGRALAAAVAASRSDTAILFISGYTGDAIVRHGVLEPGMHFLEKPFTPYTLALKVRAVLDRVD